MSQNKTVTLYAIEPNGDRRKLHSYTVSAEIAKDASAATGSPLIFEGVTYKVASVKEKTTLIDVELQRV